MSGTIEPFPGERPHNESTWIEILTLTDFRNHPHGQVRAASSAVVLVGENGAGKTNILEAISMLSPGRGMRHAAFGDLARHDGAGGWTVSARLHAGDEPISVGTGITDAEQATARSGRVVKIDGQLQAGSGVLADYLDILWLTPAMDGLFTGPGGDRRRFLDRLVLCFDPEHRTRAGQFERAMRQRNRLLEIGASRDAEFVGLERVMAETGVAIAAARRATLGSIAATILERRDRAPDSPFPWADVEIEGDLESAVGENPAVDVEDQFADRLARSRERDRSAGRTLAGPHRSDLIVKHGPKSMPARLCSTGEQKALLVGFILANAEMLRAKNDTASRISGLAKTGAPILLLDEIAAHLDRARRQALFQEILAIGSQAWMTGTDREAFSSLTETATFIEVCDGRITQAAA